MNGKRHGESSPWRFYSSCSFMACCISFIRLSHHCQQIPQKSRIGVHQWIRPIHGGLPQRRHPQQRQQSAEQYPRQLYTDRKDIPGPHHIALSYGQQRRVQHIIILSGKLISPLSGCTSFIMDFKVVVLPAPLRPIKPIIIPFSTVKDTSCN